jgi:hypothetical protein
MENGGERGRHSSVPTPGMELWREEIWKQQDRLSEEERADPT